MAGTTSKYAFPYPSNGDAPNVAGDIAALANAIDARVGLIAELTPTAGVIDFTSIPATFRALRVVGVVASASAAVVKNLGLRFNNDSGVAAYDWVATYTSVAAGPLPGGDTSDALINLGAIPRTDDGNTTAMSSLVLDLPGYREGHSTKTVMSCLVGKVAGADPAGTHVNSIQGRWMSTAVVNRLTFFETPAGTGLRTGSRLSLYGLF